jgi:transposase
MPIKLRLQEFRLHSMRYRGYCSPVSFSGYILVFAQEIGMVRMVLRNDQYRRIEARLPGKKGYPGRTAADNRRFLEAVLWIARTGSLWRDLLEQSGRWNSVYPRFARWYQKGVWQKIFGILAQDADFEEAFIDSTVIRARQRAAGASKKRKGGQALGRSRGGLSARPGFTPLSKDWASWPVSD